MHLPQLSEIRGEGGPVRLWTLAVEAAVTAACPGATERSGDGLGRNLGRTGVVIRGRGREIGGVREATGHGGERAGGEGRLGRLLQFWVESESGRAGNLLLLQGHLAVELLLLPQPRVVIGVRLVRDRDRVPQRARRYSSWIAGGRVELVSSSSVPRLTGTELIPSHLHSGAASPRPNSNLDKGNPKERKTRTFVKCKHTTTILPQSAPPPTLVHTSLPVAPLCLPKCDAIIPSTTHHSSSILSSPTSISPTTGSPDAPTLLATLAGVGVAGVEVVLESRC